MKAKKILLAAVVLIMLVVTLSGCTASYKDQQATKEIGNKLSESQPTPTDIDYSLERYNLIRRAYWVNGQRAKANAVICPVQKPLGYVVLFTEGGSVVGRFTVDGKVTYLNSYLTPDSTTLEGYWLPDVDGAYGDNDDGIFFFTPDGKYIEWTGIYLYSDIPFEVDNPVVTYKEGT
jgi:hypothetical protein